MFAGSFCEARETQTGCVPLALRCVTLTVFEDFSIDLEPRFILGRYLYRARPLPEPQNARREISATG